ncbi:helix-turn-helix domain-containing protein [Conexibacter sp. SYSU D00693]|uniref:winged helix-turn-helix transcriptional regulator n=1 Tax=Conexibacter sp. SYSU D00693 TaxID=2812560 RepID=UPI00196A3E9C|nr:helix-turn-helix domain-containing protein [Conexibacter sp. SYSU D00693]
MARTPFDQMHCSVARTLDVLGEWWTPLVLRDVAIGITRFDAIQRDLGVSRKVLAQRLGALVDHGVLRRVPYQDNPPRYDYVLTEKGGDLARVLLVLQAWGDKWVFGEEQAPVVMRHERCGQTTRPTLTCSCCGEELQPQDVTPLAGPGLADAGEDVAPEVVAALERLAAVGRRG